MTVEYRYFGYTERLGMYTITDPGASAATAVGVINGYDGVIILLTAGGNAQTLASPTITTPGKTFTVINDDASAAFTIAVNGITLVAGKGQSWVWDGTAWLQVDLGITSLPVPVNQGGTGLATITDHGIMLGSGTGAITPLGALAAGELLVGVASNDPHALAAGATTAILVGGGAADPVWTAATGTGAPVRENTPTLITPVLGVATITSANKVAITAPATSATLAPIDGTTLSNAIAVTSHGATEAATAATMYGNTHLITGAYVVTLPPAVVGMSATFMATTAAVFSIDADASGTADAIILGATELTAGNKVTSDGTIYALLYVECMVAEHWMAIPVQGVFTDGGA